MKLRFWAFLAFAGGLAFFVLFIVDRQMAMGVDRLYGAFCLTTHQRHPSDVGPAKHRVGPATVDPVPVIKQSRTLCRTGSDRCAVSSMCV